MSTPGGRKNTALIAHFRTDPQAYSFFQAVRLIERMAAWGQMADGASGAHPVARFARPAQEVVRFRARYSLQFSSAEIHAIEQSAKDSGRKQWTMTVCFMGLIGTVGVMPYHYTE